MSREQSKIVSEVYAEWAAEQAGRFEPAAEWGADLDQPSAYPESPEALSAGVEADRDLFERTTAALDAAGLLHEPRGLTHRRTRGREVE